MDSDEGFAVKVMSKSKAFELGVTRLLEGLLGLSYNFLYRPV